MKRGLISVLTVATLLAAVPLSAEPPMTAQDTWSFEWWSHLASFWGGDKHGEIPTKAINSAQPTPEDPDDGSTYSFVPDPGIEQAQGADESGNSLPDLDPNG